MNQIFVALDIETTGFNPEKDQLIEIAAVKFQGKDIIGTYETLINPGRSIPPIVSFMTGLKNEDLKNAPKFDEIKDSLIEFLGDYPIVGHNISFDVTFLIQKGIPLKNSTCDTLQLASILLPGLPSYSLDTLGRLFKIEHEQKHRAMSDTKACQTLFNLLLDKIDLIDRNTYEQITNIIAKSTWSLKMLFRRERLNEIIEPEKTAHEIEIKTELTLDTSYEFVTKKVIDKFFSEKGPLKEIINNFELRPSQPGISSKIIDCFEKEKHLVIEAGTGTGKTLAYLLAAVYFAQTHNKKVVISTYTKNLQEQIIEKDIPLLKKALQTINPKIDFKAAILKGKSNYINLTKLKKFMERPQFDDHEVTFLIKIFLWLKETKTGDLEELNTQGKEKFLKDEISYDEFTPPESDDIDINYLELARRRAEEAEIIIVNHALLLRDTFSNSEIVPEHDFIIFDEAHHLEEVATDALTINLSLYYFVKPFEKLQRLLPGHEALEIINIISRIDIFFGILGIIAEKYAEPNEFQVQYIVQSYTFNTLEWIKLRDSAKSLVESIDTIIAAFEQLPSPEIRATIFEIKKRQENLRSTILAENPGDRIEWIYKTGELSSFKSAPLNIKLDFKNKFFDSKKSIVLASATMRTENSFDFVKGQLNLIENYQEQYFSSHFDYPEQVKILIPDDLPKPATEGNFKGCATIIENAIKKNKGKTLVLFTSKKALLATYMAITPSLKQSGLEILGQGISGGRGKILEHFKQEPEKTAIFGTESFWEGIDIPGNLITCIIMQKLPFDPPNDPIINARCKQYEDAFNEYQVPRAILKFKQGFGRLIRSHKDKGTIIILDSRIIQNGYGQRFITSLPEGIKIEYGNVENLTDMM